MVWVRFDEGDLSLGPFLFFGGPAGEPLPSLDGLGVAQHTKANAEGYKASASTAGAFLGAGPCVEAVAELQDALLTSLKPS